MKYTVFQMLYFSLYWCCYMAHHGFCTFCWPSRENHQPENVIQTTYENSDSTLLRPLSRGTSSCVCKPLLSLASLLLFSSFSLSNLIRNLLLRTVFAFFTIGCSLTNKSDGFLPIILSSIFFQQNSSFWICSY